MHWQLSQWLFNKVMVIIMSIPNLLTVRQLSQKHPVFPEGGIRHRIFHAKENGLEEAGVIVRNGRRVLINEQRWFDWLTNGSCESQS